MLASLGQPTPTPSVILLALGALFRQFPMSREMTEADVDEVQQCFMRSVQLTEQSGFTGVRIHVAHDYLLS